MCVSLTKGSHTQKFTCTPLFAGLFFFFLEWVFCGSQGDLRLRTSGKACPPPADNNSSLLLREVFLQRSVGPAQSDTFFFFFKDEEKSHLLVIRAAEMSSHKQKKHEKTLGKKTYYCCACVCPSLCVCICVCVFVWVLQCLQDAQRRTSSLKSLGYNKVKRERQGKETERERAREKTRENNIHKGRARSAKCGKQSLSCVILTVPSLSPPSGGGRRKRGERYLSAF